MSQSYDPVSFSVNLACNFFLIGGLMSGGVFLVLKLIKNAEPRMRYIIAVAVFLIVAFLPAAKMSGFSIDFVNSFEASGNENELIFNQPSIEQNIIEPETVSVISEAAPMINFSESLNRFTDFAADSFAGKIFFGIWILGGFIFLSRDFYGFVKIRRERETWREATADERKTLNVPDDLPLFFGSGCPMTTGFFKPLIVLPENFPGELTLAQKRAVVRHEAAHARWRDPLAGFILRLIRSVFWINPWLLYLEKIAVAERESAADRAAVGFYSENEQDRKTAVSDYAAMLVSMAKHHDFNLQLNSFEVNAAAFYNGSILENRIRRILAESTKTSRLRAVAAMIIFAVGFAGLFLMPVAVKSENFSCEIQETSDQNADLNISQNSQFQNEFATISEPDKSEKTKKTEIVGLKKTSQKTSVKNNTNLEIPRVIYVNGRSVQTSTDESEMRKLSEQDARAAGFDKKVDELSKKVQGLDNLRKNLESDIPKVRQKAAAQIDALIQKNNR